MVSLRKEEIKLAAFFEWNFCFMTYFDYLKEYSTKGGVISRHDVIVVGGLRLKVHDLPAKEK